MVDIETPPEVLVKRRTEQLLEEFPPEHVPAQDFLGAQFDLGLAFVHFPEGYGGLGLSRDLQALVTESLDAAGAPLLYSRNVIGYGMAAPTLLAIGTPAQQRRHLRRIFTCEEIWCQLFSEPGAGSDLASLAARARRDGDEWIVSGQKVWTTLAHTARFGLLLARTDPEAEKHKGLTYFIVDMAAGGVEVRPLRQITGEAEFNEVYLTDVRIPDDQRLTAVGDGWRGALVTLMNERVAIGGAVGSKGSGPIGSAMELWSGAPEHLQTGSRRDTLMKLWVEAEVLRLTNVRAAEMARAGTPGPEGSTGKLAYAEANQRIYEFCLELLGPAGMLFDTYEMRRPETAGEPLSLGQRFLRSRANSIEGGTSEVMRNILAERVLGLSGDLRSDKSIPWSETLRA